MNDEELSNLYRLHLEGKCCASILVQMGLDMRGEENEQFAEGVSGLCNGLFSGLLCGCLTGAACMLTLFGGRKSAPMIKELAEWFESVCVERYGGIDCRDIVGDDPFKRAEICPRLLKETYETAKNILLDNDYDVGADIP
jgi:hypothetical protein